MYWIPAQGRDDKLKAKGDWVKVRDDKKDLIN
jgi:hypothetical protein